MAKVLIVPDKFKGTLSATAVAEAITRGWLRIRPADAVEVLPMSDGGEGFGEVMGRFLGAKIQTVRTVDAAHQPISAQWWWGPKTRTAIIESAASIGLALLPTGKFNPFALDTFGLGALLNAAAEAGAKRCLMGIGGSATNDGGFGLARSLGWRYFNQQGEEIRRWTDLHTLVRVVPPEHLALFDELVVAVDVQNCLLGPEGCTQVYGPQKGLRSADLESAERCLARLAAVMERQFGFKYASEAGAGAAGGLGFGLCSFVGAKLESGFELFSHHADLAGRLKTAQLVLTGEGRVDEQTLMGKGVGALAQMCRSFGVPCIVFAGQISEMAKPEKLFQRAYALTPDFATRERALAEPAICLELAAETAAKDVGW